MESMCRRAWGSSDQANSEEELNEETSREQRERVARQIIEKLSELVKTSGASEACGSDGELKLRTLVPKAAVGGIIGKGGAAIKQMRETSGAKISIGEAVGGAGPGAEQMVTVSGPEEALQTVIAEVNRQIQLLSSEAWYSTWAASTGCITQAMAGLASSLQLQPSLLGLGGQALANPGIATMMQEFCDHGLPPEADFLACGARLEEKESSLEGHAVVGLQDDVVDEEARGWPEERGEDCGQRSDCHFGHGKISERELLLLMAGDGVDDAWSEPSWDVFGPSPDQLPSAEMIPQAAQIPWPCGVLDLASVFPSALLQLPSLRVGGGPGLEGLLEGIVSQLMPMITEMIQKAIAEALGKGLVAEDGNPAARADISTAEPRLKRHKGGGRDPKRKSPETTEPPTGRGAPRAGNDTGPSGNRRVVRGKGAGGWQTVQRKREEAEPFELRGQDWDVPIVPHDAIGRKLDELPHGKPLEAVILASKSNLDTVRTILRGTSKPHRIMCVEIKKDGKERIPGRVGNQLRFKQAEITTHFSQGTAAPRYAGKKAAAVTIAPTATTTVYIRIPAAYCSADRWKEIRSSPAKTVAAWAAEQRVVLADSWGWVEETLPKQGKQLFGKARLAEKEMSSLLCCSGRGGIFVDCIRDAIPAQVQWLARIDNEPAAAYLERGLRMSAQLGLASQGGRLGARSARDPHAAIPRIWVLPHVPADWGPPEVTQVLTQSFDDVTLIHHRRTGREQLYRFRGKHKFGDRDIVPLQVQLDEEGATSEVTMWATIAPVKTPSNKQTWLRNQAVPLIEPMPPAMKATPVKAPQAPASQEDGEAQQPASVRAVSHRHLPAGVQIDDAPKDGSCLYHSVAKGLQWLTGKSYCHRDLRAKANQHIEKHLEQYLPEFDGQGPSHEKLRETHPGDDSAALKAYLKLAACESAYASNLEIKALSRIYNVCIVVVPRDPRFGTLTFKESRRAKTIALWLTPKHVKLLTFVREAALLVSRARRNRSADSQISKANSVPPDRGHAGPLSTGAEARASETESYCPEPPEPLEGTVRPARRRQARYHTSQGAAIALRGVFQCEFCPFRMTGTDRQKLYSARHAHLLHQHEGQGLFKPPPTPQLTSRGKKADFRWRCPMCKKGLLHRDVEDLPRNQLSRIKSAHRLQDHPEISAQAWKCMMLRQGVTPLRQAKLRATRLNSRHPTTVFSNRGDAFSAFVSLLSCNVARRGVITIEAVASMLRVQDAAVDINRATAPGFAMAWRHQGFQTVLGPASTQDRHRVALVSGLPMQPVQLEMEAEHDRVAAGLVSLPLGDRTVSVLIVSFYGFPSDLPRTNTAFSALMRAISVFGGLFVILGDFNCTQSEGIVATTLCSRAVRAADEAYSFEPPHTNPTNTRRIDYGLTHLDLVARSGHTFRQPDVSDHGIVRIDFGGDSFQPSWQRPRFKSFVDPRPEAALSVVFPHSELDSLLTNARLDEAWTLLSDWAETFLGIGQDLRRRSQPWRPEPRALPCGAPTRDGHEPRPLRALRHLARRLQQLVQEPWNHALRLRLTRSLGHTRTQVPGLPFIDPAFPDRALPLVQDLVESHRVAHREDCLSKWRQKIQESSTRAITWIKRRADLDLALQQPPTLQEAMTGTVHPAHRVQEQGELWIRRWQTPSTEADLPAYRRLLHNLPRHDQVELDLIPTLQELKAAMGKMRSKAPGADDWQASMFLALPQEWWEGFQRLWATVVTTGQVPSVWRRSLIVLLSKRNNATRPVALLPLAWRAGSRVVAKRLKSWVVQWNGHRACGAAPGKSVADVHARILQAWNLGIRSFIQQDLSAFFDSLSVPVITATLQHLGAPEALIQLVSGFYAQQLRLFVVDGHTTSCWRPAHIGLLQGCPLSPVLSLCVGHLWTQHVSSRQVETGIFIDDRVLWLPAGCPPSAHTAQQALQRSDEFDRAAGLTCSRPKCHIVTEDPASPWLSVARARGYTVVPSLQFLGIELSLTTGAASPLKLCLKKLRARLRHATNPAFSLGAKFQVIRSLIFPALFWAAGVALPAQEELHAIKLGVSHALQAVMTFEAPRVLIGQVLGWTSDPFWMADWASLSALIRSLTRPLDGSEEDMLSSLRVTRLAGNPAAVQTVRRLGWQLDAANRQIRRRDDRGTVRVFHFGEDSMAVLRRWLTESHVQEAARSCGRIARRMHRDDPTLAVGLDLPPPGVGLRFAFLGHGSEYRTAASQNAKRACLVTGGTAWHFRRKHGGTQPTCLCGRAWPSRSHLLWVCPALCEIRATLAPPVDRVEERLLGHPISEHPGPPANEVPCRAPLVRLFETAAEANLAELTLATDGSSLEGIGSFAITCNRPWARIAGADTHEDQAPFRMELRALDELLAALLETPRPPRRVWILVDCEAAIRALCCPTQCSIRLLAERAFASGHTLRQRGVEWSLAWIPSHGKRSTWSPPPQLPATMEECRQLNHTADDEAQRLCKSRHHNSLRAYWQKEVVRASTVEKVAQSMPPYVMEDSRGFALSCVVPNRLVGGLIGRGGSGTKEVQMLTGTKIGIREIPDDPDNRSLNIATRLTL
ncbi:unnamed protein product [Symbiodinium sp. KB8]|nr:unnamed protein product [Symbiodinium sp. KB8]